MSNQPHRSNLMKSLTLQKQSANHSFKENTLGGGAQLPPQFTNSQSNFLRDSYETFGGNLQNNGLNNDLDFLEEKGSTFNSLQNKFQLLKARIELGTVVQDSGAPTTAGATVETPALNTKSPISGASSYRRINDDTKTEEIGVQEMLKRYQEKYKKQKEESIG